ncbi:H/ACA ribonucleoprotein complex subunit 3, putative [Plasmodium sp. gorilla clade G3]|nr:H/ACA ribonucleoprotein complex subunit 3, putative [Plasmodium sp. gorilla clade G3]
MYMLRFYLDENGKRVYTVKPVVNGKVTFSAHPCRFSPDDKFSLHRINIKKRFNLL